MSCRAVGRSTVAAGVKKRGTIPPTIDSSPTIPSTKGWNISLTVIIDCCSRRRQWISVRETDLWQAVGETSLSTSPLPLLYCRLLYCLFYSTPLSSLQVLCHCRGADTYCRMLSAVMRLDNTCRYKCSVFRRPNKFLTAKNMKTQRGPSLGGTPPSLPVAGNHCNIMSSMQKYAGTFRP